MAIKEAHVILVANISVLLCLMLLFASVFFEHVHNMLSDLDGVSNHEPNDCLLNRLFRCRSKKTPKLRVTDLCAGNSPVTGEFPAQRASNAENVSISWRHHVNNMTCVKLPIVCWYLMVHMLRSFYKPHKNIEAFAVLPHKQLTSAVYLNGRLS